MESSTKTRYEVMEFTHGPIRRSIQVSGKRTKCMEKVNSFGLMEKSTKENFKMTNVTGKESSPGKMGEHTTAAGPEGNNLERGSSQIIMEKQRKGCGSTEKGKSGLMIRIMSIENR